MAKCEICKKRWLFSKMVKCDCPKKRVITHTHQGTTGIALTSNPPKYSDPNLQYFSTIALKDIEPKIDDCSEDQYRSQYHHDTSHSNHSSHSSSDSSGWSSGSSDSSSCDSGSSSSSDSW